MGGLAVTAAAAATATAATAATAATVTAAAFYYVFLLQASREGAAPHAHKRREEGAFAGGG